MRLRFAFIAAVLLATACSKKDEAKPGTTAATTPGMMPGQSKEDLAQVIAKIDDVVITVGDFQDRLNKQSPYIRARYTSVERKKEFLDNLVRFEVLAKEAKKRGFDNDAEVVRTMKQVMIQKLMKEEFETRVKLEDVTDPEMQKYFEEHKTEYNKPEEVRVSAIILKDKKTADKVAAEAKGPKGADNKGFRDLVTAHSTDDASKMRGGDLRWFAADTTEVPPEVVKAAFTLQKTGDVAGPVESKGSFYVIKQMGRRKALLKTFEEVKRQIQNRLYRDKRTKAMEDFVANLKNNAKVEVFDDKLGKVVVDTSASDPEHPGGMGGPGGQDPHLGLPGMAPGGPMNAPNPGGEPANQ